MPSTYLGVCNHGSQFRFNNKVSHLNVILYFPDIFIVLFWFFCNPVCRSDGRYF